MPSVPGGAARRVFVQQPVAEERGQTFGTLQRGGQRCSLCGVKPRMLDPEGHVGHHAGTALTQIAGNLVQKLLPPFAADARRIGKPLGNPPPSHRVDRVQRVRQKLKQRREVQRCPKQLHRQRHQLQCRPQRARACQAQAWPVGRGQGGIQQRTPTRRHDHMRRAALAHLHRLPLCRAKNGLGTNDAQRAIATPCQPRGALAITRLAERVLQIAKHRSRTPRGLDHAGIHHRQVVQNPAPREREVSERIEKLDAFDLRAAMPQRARHISQPLPQARRDGTRSQGFNRHHVGQPIAGTCTGTCTGTSRKRATPAMLEPHVAPPEQGGGAAQFIGLEAAGIEPRRRHGRPKALPHLDHALGLRDGGAKQSEMGFEHIQQPERSQRRATDCSVEVRARAAVDRKSEPNVLHVSDQ